MSVPEPQDTRPYQLPAIRREFAHLCNRIAGRSRPLQFNWNGQPAVFSFAALSSGPRGGWILNILLGGHEMTVALNRLPDVAWVSPALAGIDLQGLPPELACGIIESCLGDVFDALSKGGIDVSILTVEPYSLRNEPAEAIGWSIDRGSEIGWMRGTVSGNDLALDHLASLIQRAPATPILDDSTVPVGVDVVAGQLRMALSELKQVEVHDVILADVSGYLKAKECQIWAGFRALASGNLQGQTLTLRNLNPLEAVTMSEAAPAAVPVNDLDIQLTFVVGHTTLTVGDLRSLAPGAVLELPSAVGDGVAICANGKTIGRGELIEVGDRVGVRVTEFSAS